MKILFYIHNLQIGGAERIVADEIIQLKNRGVDVVLVVNNTTGSFLEDRVISFGIKQHVLQRRMPNNRIAAFVVKVLNRFANYRNKFNKIIELEKPDLIHIHTLLDRIYGINFPEDRFVYTFHSDVSRSIETNTKKNAKCLKILAKRGMSFFALSEKMKLDIKRSLQTNKVSVIPNAIDVGAIRSNAYSRDFLESISIPKDAYVVGHVGRFDLVKNHEKIINVFSKIHELKQNSFLVLIGGGSSDRIEKIKKDTWALGISKYVRFLGIRKDATSILNCFDCFLLPSFSESFSLALIESQSLNIRSIASNNVPLDVICNCNCFALPLSRSDEYWASVAVSNTTHKKEKDVMEFDFSNVLPRMINEYKRVYEK